MKKKYERPSISAFINWVLRGDISTGTLAKTTLWLILYAFIGLFVIFLCLPFYILRDIRARERVRGGEKKG